MKIRNTFITYKTTIITLFLTIAGTTAALCQTPPTPPVGLEEPRAVEIDLYVIPMIIVGLIFAFFLLKKNTRI